MKKILMLVVLACATFATPCYGGEKKIIEGDPKVVDTLSYCLGATMALEIKNDVTMSLFDFDIESFNKGLTEVLLDRPSISHDSAIRTLEHFFSETAAARLVEHAAVYAMDNTAVFKPFINSTERNKVSHALGVMMAGEIKKPIEEESYTVQCYWLCRGIEECYTQKLSISLAAMASFIERMDAKSSGSATPATEAPAANAERSAQWLAERAAESGVQKTASGLLYKVVSQGDMTRAAMSDEDIVCVHYVGRKMDGTVFDASRFEWRSKQQQDAMRKNYPSMFDENGKRVEEDKPIEFSLKNVIAGWTEGVKLVGAGGKVILYIPAELAYGERGAGRDIGPNEALEFEVELIDVKPATK